MPHRVKPMLATLTDKPFSSKDYIFEIKWDGYRAIAEIRDGNVELYSRNNLSFNDKFFPVVQKLQNNFNTDIILDGEIVVLDEKGRASFQLLQNYQRTGKGNLVYYVFDIIYLDGYNLTKMPLIKRKNLLRKIFPDIAGIRFSDHIEEHGEEFFNMIKEKNLEGILAKNAKSEYCLGRRTRDWLKIKTSQTQEAVICGFSQPRGSREKFGSLVLGIYKGKTLIHIGHAGGGFTEEKLNEVYSRLEPLKTTVNPFKTKIKTNTPVTWVKPELVCEVTFSEWTDEGLLRQPVFIGLREDKDPRSITLETSEDPAGDENFNSAGEETKGNGEDMKNNKPNVEVTIGKRKLKLTNLDKIYFPDEGYTKGDVINYYRKVSKYILPYLKGRPESLNRHPNGIYEESFYQKNVDGMPPDWIHTEAIYSDHNKKDITYMVCNDEATLVYMANLGCIEINPWFSRVDALDNPDYLVLDLDPEDIPFDKVIEAAYAVKEVLDTAGANSFCKTSGATGMHIYVPLNAKYDYEVARNFAHLVARIAHGRTSDFTSLLRSPSKRQKKVYLDYLQNRTGQTLAAPYSLRPRPGAPVSTPLKWEEVKTGLDPRDFNIDNIEERLKKAGDIFKGVLGPGIKIEKCVKNLESKPERKKK